MGQKYLQIIFIHNSGYSKSNQNHFKMRFFFLLATLVAVATAQQQCGCAAPQPIQIQLSCGGQQPIPQPPPQECVAPAPAPEPQPEPEPEPEPEPATEGPANEAVACMTDNDLALVIDSSTSWSIGTYNSAIDFAAQFAKTWRENPGNGVTLNTFASVGETPIPLTHSMSPDEIHDAIKAVPWLQGSIRVDLGIDEARRQLAGSDRAGVPKNIVVFTDGVTDDWALLDASLANVAQEGQRVFVVAMGAVAGGGAMQEQLKKIALGHEDHIFYVEEIGGDGLMNILRDISQRACEADSAPNAIPARRR